MSFFRLLEHIQKKPERTRTTILAVSVAVIMLFIIAVWITLPDVKKKEKNAETAGPFELLWDKMLTSF